MRSRYFECARALVVCCICAHGSAYAGPAARAGDPNSLGGTILSGAPLVLINGSPAARNADPTDCPLTVPPSTGQVAGGAAQVLINGRPAVRQNDPVVGCVLPGLVTNGSPNVLIGP
jgi:Uncharacterized conserved protein